MNPNFRNMFVASMLLGCLMVPQVVGAQEAQEQIAAAQAARAEALMNRMLDCHPEINRATYGGLIASLLQRLYDLGAGLRDSDHVWDIWMNSDNTKLMAQMIENETYANEGTWVQKVKALVHAWAAEHNGMPQQQQVVTANDVNAMVLYIVLQRADRIGTEEKFDVNTFGDVEAVWASLPTPAGTPFIATDQVLGMLRIKKISRLSDEIYHQPFNKLTFAQGYELSVQVDAQLKELGL